MIAARVLSRGMLDIAVGYQYRVTKGVVSETLFNERLLLVTTWPRQRDWRANYVAIGWDEEFKDEQRRIIGELENRSRLRAPLGDCYRYR